MVGVSNSRSHKRRYPEPGSYRSHCSNPFSSRLQKIRRISFISLKALPNSRFSFIHLSQTPSLLLWRHLRATLGVTWISTLGLSVSRSSWYWYHQSFNNFIFSWIPPHHLTFPVLLSRNVPVWLCSFGRLRSKIKLTVYMMLFGNFASSTDFAPLRFQNAMEFPSVSSEFCDLLLVF